MSTARKELHAAVHLLTGTGPQRDRLAAVFTRHLLFLRPDDLPPDVRERFVALVNVLYVNRIHEPARKDASLFDAADSAEISAMARTVLELYAAVIRDESALAEKPRERRIVTTPPRG